jgi:hypothetical protein
MRARETNPEVPSRSKARAAAAHLEVAGVARVEDPAEEVAELAEGEEEAVAEERGERGHVREPHHPLPHRSAGGWQWRRRRPEGAGFIAARVRAGVRLPRGSGSGRQWRRERLTK